MKRAKELGPEPLRGLWWVEQGKGGLTKRPSSRQHKPRRNNNSSRKRRQTLRTNRVSTRSSGHFPLAWTLADTPSSDSLALSPGKRLTGHQLNSGSIRFVEFQALLTYGSDLAGCSAAF